MAAGPAARTMARWTRHQTYGALPGRLLMLGFGSIGQAALPLLLRHFELAPGQVTVLPRDPDHSAIAGEYGVAFEPPRCMPAITKASSIPC